jgi:hypothetical protein
MPNIERADKVGNQNLGDFTGDGTMYEIYCDFWLASHLSPSTSVLLYIYANMQYYQVSSLVDKICWPRDSTCIVHYILLKYILYLLP